MFRRLKKKLNWKILLQNLSDMVQRRWERGHSPSPRRPVVPSEGPGTNSGRPRMIQSVLFRGNPLIQEKDRYGEPIGSLWYLQRRLLGNNLYKWFYKCVGNKDKQFVFWRKLKIQENFGNLSGNRLINKGIRATREIYRMRRFVCIDTEN